MTNKPKLVLENNILSFKVLDIIGVKHLRPWAEILDSFEEILPPRN